MKVYVSGVDEEVMCYKGNSFFENEAYKSCYYSMERSMSAIGYQ